jgi:hypothetical protein
VIDAGPVERLASRRGLWSPIIYRLSSSSSSILRRSRRISRHRSAGTSGAATQGSWAAGCRPVNEVTLVLERPGLVPGFFLGYRIASRHRRLIGRPPRRREEGSRREAGLFTARISTMNKGLLLIAAALLVVSAAYSLNRGIFVGSERVLHGPAPCHMVMGFEWKGGHPVSQEALECQEGGYIDKQCYYLFISGISKIGASYNDGILGPVYVPHAADPNEVRLAYSKPEKGYCRLFAPR